MMARPATERGMGGTGATSRRRGVRASRAPLEEAMAAAGLRRQAALAERTADLEGLEAVPRDMVSRVFRQRPVDPPTIYSALLTLGACEDDAAAGRRWTSRWRPPWNQLVMPLR